MASSKILVLVTGANGGIGFELVAQLMAKGSYHVYLGSRSAEKGAAAVKDLESRGLPGSTEMIQLDVTDDKSIERAFKTIDEAHGKLDILVSNAAIGSESGNTLREQMIRAFDTNTLGPALVGHAFAPLLKNSSIGARIINVSSGAGSIGRRLDPSGTFHTVPGLWPYRVSKAALSMVSACQKVEYEPVKVFTYCPGFTVSNLSYRNTAENGARPTADSVKMMMEVIEGKRDDEAGTFIHGEGSYPW